MKRATKLGFEEARELQEQLMKRMRTEGEKNPYLRRRLFYVNQRLAVTAARLRLAGKDVPPACASDWHIRPGLESTE